MRGKAEAVLVRPWFAVQLLEKPLLVPNLEMIDASEHAHVAYNRRALAQMRGNHDAALGVELAGLSVVVHAIEVLEAGGKTARYLQQLPLDFQPGRKGVNSDTLSRQARDEHVGPVLVLDDPSKHGGHLQPALVVDPGRRAAAERVLLHFAPQKSTGILSLGQTGCQPISYSIF